ncbi:MAG: 16S rRNA (guanine(527)-N(7))-methyltransferase RsmG [Pirellulaceae bacterium]|nr:16S rRNA (guanine(527)-N(7))-methyltransferase RsmG [Pirellulaceae bacterium]
MPVVTELPPTADETPPANPYPGDTLPAALGRHGIALPADQIERLDQYCRLLWEWNEKINLTRHTDYEKFVARDLVDSLQLAKHLNAGEEVLDVGTGGGVPGLLLAIVRPDLRVSLCDSVGKKIKVVDEISRALGLETTTFPFRAEEVLEDTRYDALVLRAVGPLWKLLTWFRPHWPSLRRLLIIKGPKWEEELPEAKRRGLLRELDLKVAARYDMPGTGSQSVILKIWPKGTPER